MNCRDETTAGANFRRIGQCCCWPGSEHADIDAIKHQLASVNKRTLLVLDNCDDDTTDFSKYFPGGEHITVIMTSRFTENQSYATRFSAERSLRDWANMTGLDPKDGQALVSQIVTEEGQRQRDDAFEKDTAELARVLEFHPLSICIASAVIRDGYTVHEFLSNSETSEQRKSCSFDKCRGARISIACSRSPHPFWKSKSPPKSEQSTV